MLDVNWGHLSGSGALVVVALWTRRHLKLVWKAIHRVERFQGMKKSETPDFFLGPEEITKNDRAITGWDEE